MGMTNFLGNSVLTTFFKSSGHYLGLHVNDPTATGLASTELAGGSYIRQSISWTAPSGRTVLNANTLTFHNLPAATVSYLAVWDAATGGHCLYSLQVTTITTSAGGTFVVPIHDLAVVLS